MDAGERRDRMVDKQLVARDIDDPAVIAAMRRVPREEFVPTATVAEAYADRALPIGHHVTISQPYIVALMAQALRLRPTDRVLEVGTGSGYSAAVIAEQGCSLVTVETIEPLARLASDRLARYGDRVEVVHGDGTLGYPAQAPYDAISVTAAAGAIPPPLLDQLALGGRLVMPVGTGTEHLVIVTRTADGFARSVIARVRFVPLTGAHGAQPPGGDPPTG